MKTLELKEVKEELPPFLVETDVVALDLELVELKEGQLHRPAGHMLSLACTFDGEIAYIIYNEEDVPEFLNRIDKATWVFHNSAFDIGHLRRWADVPERGNMRDTLIIERNMFSNYYEDFSLADLVRRYLKCYMPKDVRKEFAEHQGSMTPEQIKYACLDVIGTWLVDKEQQKIIDPIDLNVWNITDKPDVYTSVSLSGFELDQDAWISLKDRNQMIVDEIEENLGQKYGKKIIKKKRILKKFRPVDAPNVEAYEDIETFVPFNPSSSVQVLDVLRSQGLDIDSTGDDVIRPYYDTNEVVKDILDYRNAAKKVSTYGMSFLKYVEPDGRIYTSLNVALAISGRDSSSSPNLQNILKDDEYRACFIAGKGKKLVIADYSAQEIRIFSYRTQDPKLIEIVKSGKDIHCEIARIAFNENITKKDKKRRGQIKGLIFGLIYGLSPAGFARDNDMDVESAQEMFDKFFETFDVAAIWYKETKYTKAEFIRTALGRKIWLHPYSYKRQTLALNCYMQGTGADMTKLAMKEFRQVNKQLIDERKVGIILPVHDEIVVWCVADLAEQVEDALRYRMISVAERIHKGIPAEVGSKICDNWAEKGG